MTGRIILVRHGQTASNIHRIIDTRPPGAELSQLGRAQAAAVGRELADYSGARLAHLYCSVALRAQQTAVLAAAAFESARELPAGGLPVDVRTGVHEIFAGRLERVAGEENIAAYLQVLRGMFAGDPQAGFPDGEATGDVLARTRPVLESIAAELEDAPAGPAAADGRDIALVTHGGAGRTMAALACGVDPDQAFRDRLPNCRLIVVEPAGRPFGSWRLVRWDTAEIAV